MISILALFISTAYAYEPKLHFNDCVMVEKGFYSGCIGRVKAFTGLDYEVEAFCKGDGIRENFPESNLKLLKDKACK